MQKFLTVLALAALLSGCATIDQYDIRPDAQDDGIPTAVAWQNDNDAVLAAATATDVLLAFVATDAAADGLLAKLQGAYESDPVTMTQIGCVTLAVIGPEGKKTPTLRQRWVAALERCRAKTTDDYVKTFCLQQLWLCRE